MRYTHLVAVRTIFAMAEDCGRGERLGWYEFVRDYSTFTRDLLLRYFPVLAPDMEEHVAGVYRRAQANENAWFQRIRFTNEREFAFAYREFIFAYGREAARLPVPEISIEQMREIMKDLPVVEQQMLWMVIRGYDAAYIGRMMMNAEATARAVKDKADQRVRALIPAASPDALVLSARALMEAAEQTRTDDCLPLKTFNNLINGQLSWRERDLAEQHVARCFYCLDRFTTFQEVIRLRKDVQPAPEAAVEAIMAKLGFAAKSKGLLAKLLGK